MINQIEEIIHSWLVSSNTSVGFVSAKIAAAVKEKFDDTYTLVQWPYSQDYMEEDWFEDEAVLALGSEHITGDSAYFIPTHRV